MVGSNALSGPLPDLRGCPRLAVLCLRLNQLTGTVPSFAFCRGTVREVDFGFNRLHGAVPNDAFAGCTRLQHLNLSSCNQLGALPTGLSLLPCCLVLTNRG